MKSVKNCSWALMTILVFAAGRGWGQPPKRQSTPGLPGQPPATAGTAQPVDEATYRQQVGYMLGQSMGRNLREAQIDCDIDGLVAGITDALRGTPPKWSEPQLEACRARFEQEMRMKTTNRVQQMADQNSKQAQQFLAQNKQQPGVTTTASGLQYKVLKQGAGASPALTDTVRCHYRGTLLDGTEFDSSLGGDPAEFPVNQVIPGWTEALQLMKVGDKWQLFVPADLAYGMQPPGPPIQPNSLLVFEVELLGISSR
jgi:FKBP-type peptidyl-prolyl cis-trans isomerase FklB